MTAPEKRALRRRVNGQLLTKWHGDADAIRLRSNWGDFDETLKVISPVSNPEAIQNDGSNDA
jgi:hypothetical protein